MNPRRGTILVAVMVIMTFGAMLAAAMLFRMRAELRASTAMTSRQQADATITAGLAHVMEVLRRNAGQPDLWVDNPELFADQLVVDDGVNRWYFTVYAPSRIDPTTCRYGLIDEAGKINVNHASEDTLRALLADYQDVDVLVDSLLDYRDQDDETRPSGAEQTYYDDLPQPFLIRNRPFIATIEELLLVRGFTGRVVYGEDHNLNGILDPAEDDRNDSFPDDNGDGELSVGMMGLATTNSYEYDTSSRGEPRININGPPGELGKLKDAGFSDETVEFITQYRAAGKVFRDPSELLNMTYTGPVKIKRTMWRRGREVEVTETRRATIQSGVGARQLPRVMDLLTVLPGGDKRRVWGRVNVNTAPREVLAALPGSDHETAGRIVEARLNLEPSALATTAWLFSEQVVDAEQFKKIAPHVTSRGFQYRVRVVGYAWPAGTYRTVEAIIDLAGGDPKIIYQRDITRLGLPFALDPESQEL